MSDIVDRLAAHRVLAGAPRSELEWLATHGAVRRYQVGEYGARKNEPVDQMIIQLTGRVVSTVDRGSGRRFTLETRGGDISALLPFSRVVSSLGDWRVEEETELLAVHRDMFPELIRECPTVVERLVHLMIDRSRVLSSTTVEDDRLQSLARLAAGLAHELNNPASAAVRSAKLLRQALQEASAAAAALGAANLTADQRAAAGELSAQNLMPSHTGVYSAIERADREEGITRWLEDHRVDPALADVLSDSALTTEGLDRLAAAASGAALERILHSIAADYAVVSLATDVERATVRIHDLVSAVKGFSNLGRAASPTPMDIAQGLADTLTVLSVKARTKSVAVRLDVPAELPLVMAGDELNQVWSNLLDNAIDAVGESGEIQVRATRDRDEIVVRVIDNGPGIPREVEPRMFDPFFTTKPQGQGTGLGLDLVRRIVVAHGGQIAVETRPGRTEFRVTLPVAPVAATDLAPMPSRA